MPSFYIGDNVSSCTTRIKFEGAGRRLTIYNILVSKCSRLPLRRKGNTFAECSKRQRFSPSQPWRAETRLVPSKAAGELKPEVYPQGYIEDFNELRTKLAAFFSILLLYEQQASLAN